MTYKNNVNKIFSPTLKSIWPLWPGYKNFMDIIYRISFFSYFEEYPTLEARSSKLYRYDI